MGGLLLAAGFMAFVAWDQSHWWRAKEDYGFGWFVPVFVAYTIYDRWPRVAARLGATNAGGVQTSRPAWCLSLIPIAMSAVLAGGGALFLLGALYRAAAGASYAGTLAITLGMAMIVLASIYFAAPTSSNSPMAQVIDRLDLTRLFVFPALVWLVSAPMITLVENNLSVFLMHQVTSVVFFIFDSLGLSLEQQGNVLLLPTGSVGVAEACSGIRSLTGCLFAGSFLAATFLEPRWKKAALMVASLVLAFTTNVLRSVFLTAWSYRYGPAAIEGKVHDTAGYVVLGLTVVGLLCLLPILNRRRGPGRKEQGDSLGAMPEPPRA
jgi:exosortase